VVLVAAAFLAALAALAGGTVLFLYDRATAIDRSSPEGVAVQFLDAAIVAKDPNRVALFVCDGWPAEQAMAAAIPPAQGNVSSTWNDLVARVDGDRATATVTVQFVSSSPRVRYSEDWTLTLARENGWRVCDLTRGPSLEP
jgi:hypothetical protein